MDKSLHDIEKKVLAGERLSFEDGVRLFSTDDIFTLGRLANFVREKKNGNNAYYIRNMHLNYSNICVHTCGFCYGGFARRAGEEGAYEMTLEDIFSRGEEARRRGADEIHIVGGVHPTLPYKFYLDMLLGLKERFPEIHLKAFTAVEIEHLSRIGKRTVEQVLVDLMEAGMDSMPGGGAEVFANKVWKEICGTKTKPENWLNIHRTAHKLGLRSTCTMLYGHIETVEDRVDHILRLRALQDETGGFTAFIPLAFHPENTLMQKLPKPTAITDLRVHAVARLLLDNFDHIKAYWIMTGLKMAQLLLHYGVDDIDGTIVEEKIVHMAGATSPKGVTEEELRHLIIEAGRTPVRRDTLYRVKA